jgi:hypothetical protein
MIVREHALLIEAAQQLTRIFEGVLEDADVDVVYIAVGIFSWQFESC